MLLSDEMSYAYSGAAKDVDLLERGGGASTPSVVYEDRPTGTCCGECGKRFPRSLGSSLTNRYFLAVSDGNALVSTAEGCRFSHPRSKTKLTGGDSYPATFRSPAVVFSNVQCVVYVIYALGIIWIDYVAWPGA